MNINKGKIISGLIATSIVVPMSGTISHADDYNVQIKSVEYMSITGNSVNFRTGPGTNYSSMGKLNKGYRVEYIGTSGKWMNIKYNGNIGYVHSDYISKTSDNLDTSVKSIKVVTGNSVNFRTGPSTSNSSIGKLNKGTEVEFISQSNGWSKISYNGKIGYMSSQYLSNKGDTSIPSTPSNGNVDGIISFAKTLLGKPYVWGAEGPNSFDCSGFTQYVLKKSAGVSIPRVSREQSKFGQSVSKSNLKKGDLVFFDTEGTNNGNVTHCGIYIGNGEMIHASSSGKKVMISKISSGYYDKAFVNAKRVLKNV